MLKNPKYLYGDQDFSIPLSLNFGDFFLRRLLQYKDTVAFINATEDKSVTYGVLYERSVRLASSLWKLGVKAGECVGVCAESNFDYFCVVVAATFNGAVVTPLGIFCSKDEMKHVTSISKPTFMFCSRATHSAYSDLWRTMPTLNKLILFGNQSGKGELCFEELVSESVLYEDLEPATVSGQAEPAFILYSSGTTGLPKGVRLSHYNGISCCVTYGCAQLPGSCVRNMTVSPWYHAMGFWGALTNLANGNTIVYLDKFQEDKFLKAIEKYKTDCVRVPPTVVVLLAKSASVTRHDLSAVRVVYSGAAPLDMDTIVEVKRRLPSVQHVMQGYGMTETTLAVTRDIEHSNYGVRLKSSGRPFCASVIKIVDIETRKPLGPHERGEILVKGPTVMLGYVGKKRSEDFDSEGFFLTGDIGYYDEQSYLYVVDRLKELIKYKGFQVPPAELEAVLLQHPGIRDAAVVGKPDRAAGELPLAFVVLQAGQNADIKDDILTFVNEKVSNPKKLRGGIRFIDQIPKNPSGKILRKELRKIINESKL